MLEDDSELELQRVALQHEALSFVNKIQNASPIRETSSAPFSPMHDDNDPGSPASTLSSPISDRIESSNSLMTLKKNDAAKIIQRMFHNVVGKNQSKLKMANVVTKALSHQEKLASFADDLIISSDSPTGLSKKPSFRASPGWKISEADVGVESDDGSVGSHSQTELKKVPSFKFPKASPEHVNSSDNSLRKTGSFGSGKGPAPAPPKRPPPGPRTDVGGSPKAFDLAALTAAPTLSLSLGESSPTKNAIKESKEEEEGEGEKEVQSPAALRIQAIPVSPVRPLYIDVDATLPNTSGLQTSVDPTLDTSKLTPVRKEENGAALTPLSIPLAPPGISAPKPPTPNGKQSPKKEVLISPKAKRPLSRDDVRAMVIPPFSPLRRQSSADADSEREANSSSPITLSTPKGRENNSQFGGFAIIVESEGENSRVDFVDDLNIPLGQVPGHRPDSQMLHGDLSQHNFYSTTAGGSEVTVHKKLIEGTDAVFNERPGTHERPSSTQVKYMSLYGQRLATPKAVELAQEEGFADDLELSHRSFDSQLTENFSTTSSTSQLPFPFTKAPGLPHVDSHISKQEMHFNKIKAKFLTPAEVEMESRKAKYIARKKRRLIAAKRAEKEALKQREIEFSLIAEFSKEQIENAMEYFKTVAVGLSDEVFKQTGNTKGSYQHHDIFFTSDLDAVKDEIKLNELEAVLRKFRRAQINEAEESYGRDLLVSLEWLLEQLNLGLMEWFHLTDTTRVNELEKASAQPSSFYKTQGNGKLSHLELTFGIDLLCQRLSDKLSKEATEEAEAAHAQEVAKLSSEQFKSIAEDEHENARAGRKRTNSKDSPQERSRKNSLNTRSPLTYSTSPYSSVLDDPVGSPSQISVYASPSSSHSPEAVKERKRIEQQNKARKAREMKVTVPLWKRSDIAALMKHLDPNSDGDISIEEIKLAFRNLHSDLKTKQLMQEAGPIVKRLVEYLLERHLTVRDLFHMIDTDRSGTISSVELFNALNFMPSLRNDSSAGFVGEDDLSVGPVSIDSDDISMSSQSLANMSINTQNTRRSVTSSLSKCTYQTSRFRSPFKYVPGSRAIKGVKAFGKPMESQLEIKQSKVKMVRPSGRAGRRKNSVDADGLQRSRASPTPEVSRDLPEVGTRPGTRNVSPNQIKGQKNDENIFVDLGDESFYKRKMDAKTRKLDLMSTSMPVFPAIMGKNGNKGTQKLPSSRVPTPKNSSTSKKRSNRSSLVPMHPRHMKTINRFDDVWQRQIVKLDVPDPERYFAK